MKSVFAISITPFDEAGRMDEGALRRHLHRMAAAGVGVYVGGSGSGEGYSLSSEERDRLFAIAAEEVSGRIPVRAMGVEPRSAKEVIDLASAARQHGLDAMQVYSLDLGHGHLPSPPEVEAYLGEVLAAVDLPVVLSTHQSAGYRIAPALLASLVETHPQVIGVNCTHADLGYLAAVIDAVGGRAEVHVGGPGQALSAMALGADGYLSSEANLAPRLCALLVERYHAADLDGAADAFAKVIRLSTLLYANGGIRASKAVLAALGLPGGIPRRPQLPLTADRAAEILAAVTALGALELEGVGP